MTSGAVPELSVIVTGHGRHESLRRCLTSLAKQAQDPSSFEVIVATEEPSDAVAIGDALEAPFRLRAASPGQRGRASALSAAIELAEGEICLFMDQNVVASPQLAAEHMAAHREGRLIGIGRLTRTPPHARDWYAHTRARALNESHDELKVRPASWRDCEGGSFSVARKSLIEVDASTAGIRTAEGVELPFRLQEVGCAPTYLPLAEASLEDRRRRRELLADVRRAGSESIELTDRHPGMLAPRLGGFGNTGVSSLLLRRLLLALRVPPIVPALLGALLPGAGRRLAWYRFISSYAFWLGVRRATDRTRWSQLTRGLPILMYHAFASGGAPDRFIQPERSFARQMAVLRALRYRVIALDQLIDAVRTGGRLPRRAVVLTADDGYEDNLRIVQPILRKRGFPVTIFLVTGRLGKTNDWSTGSTAGRPLMSAEQARGTQGEGLELGAHTRRHRSLPDAEAAEIREEVEGSRADLEALLAKPIRTFAYPYGHVDERTRAVVRDSGFEMALSVDDRRATVAEDPMRVPRIEIRGTDSILRFLRRLWL